jgi:hypothetical protein
MNECKCCLAELDDDQIVYYQHSGDATTWFKSNFCWETIKIMLAAKFQDYMKAVYNSKCKIELAGIVEKGPPVWFTDKGLPVPDGEHVTLFRSIDGETVAQYVGAVTGEERDKLWETVKFAVNERIKYMQKTDD